MLVQRGTLKVGDAVVAGDAYGRVKALFDYKGERRESAVPGEPVEILGFDKPPAAGELARVVENDREARDLANRRGERLRREQLASVAADDRRLARGSLRAAPGRRGLRSQPRRPRRRRRLGRGRRLGAVEVRALRGAAERDRRGSGGDHAERHHARVRLRRSHRRLQRPPERRGARARGARGRRDPHLRRHLQAHRGDRAGARRQARRRQDRGDDRRGRGACALPRLPARHDRRLHGHPRRRPPQRRAFA